MEKPIVLKIEELKQNIIDTLEASELPIFIIEPMMKDIYQSCYNSANAYKAEQVYAYQKSLEQENQNNQDKDTA